jgi:hypothetical protein
MRTTLPTLIFFLFLVFKIIPLADGSLIDAEIGELTVGGDLQLEGKGDDGCGRSRGTSLPGPRIEIEADFPLPGRRQIPVHAVEHRLNPDVLVGRTQKTGVSCRRGSLCTDRLYDQSSVTFSSKMASMSSSENMEAASRSSSLFPWAVFVKLGGISRSATPPRWVPQNDGLHGNQVDDPLKNPLPDRWGSA